MNPVNPPSLSILAAVTPPICRDAQEWAFNAAREMSTMDHEGREELDGVS